MKEVTDTALLEQLNAAPAGGAEVTDPDILAQLDPDYVDTRIDMDEWTPVPEGQKNLLDQALSGASGYADSVLMGFGGEVGAGLETAWEKIKSNQQGADFPWSDTYNAALNKGNAAREQLAAQYPDEYSAGEWTGIGATVVNPGAVTKSGLALAGKAKGFADEAIETGATKIKDLVVEPLQGLPKVKKVVEGAVPSSVGDLAAMGTGAAVSPLNPITGAVGALATKRGVEAGTTALGKRVAQNKERLSELGGLKEHAKKTAEFIPDDSSAMFGNKSFYVDQAAKAKKEIVDLEQMIKSDYVGRAAGKVYDLNQQYGAQMRDWAARGTDAFTANQFIKQQTDPEFREMLRAAREEAANNAE